MAGYGEGNIKLTQPDTTETIRTGIDLAMVAVGARGDLMPRTEAAGFDLALTTDALMVRTTSAAAGGLAASAADVSRLRLGLDGSWLVALDSGASLTPSIGIGMRHDGGDAETGFGIDLGGGLAYADEQSGLGLELNARALLAHEDENFREWGVSGALIFDPDPSSDRGLSLSVGPSWGASSTGGAEALLGPETMSGLALDNTPPPGGRLGVEAAWGRCHVNHRVTSCGRRRRRLCNGRHLPPLSHRVAAELAECSAGDQMALDVEEVVDGRMDGEEPLRGRGRFEPLHLSLSSSHRLM